MLATIELPAVADEGQGDTCERNNTHDAPEDHETPWSANTAVSPAASSFLNSSRQHGGLETPLRDQDVDDHDRGRAEHAQLVDDHRVDEVGVRRGAGSCNPGTASSNRA